MLSPSGTFCQWVIVHLLAFLQYTTTANLHLSDISLQSNEKGLLCDFSGKAWLELDDLEGVYNRTEGLYRRRMLGGQRKAGPKPRPLCSRNV